MLGLSASLLSGVQYAKIPPLFVGQLGVGVRGGEYIFFTLFHGLEHIHYYKQKIKNLLRGLGTSTLCQHLPTLG